MGNKNAALEDYNEAIKINPKNADYYSNRGALLSKIGKDLKQAEEDLTKSIKLDGSDPDKYLTRAIIYCKENLYLAAIDDLNILLNMDSDNKQARELRSYAIKSLTHEQEF